MHTTKKVLGVVSVTFLAALVVSPALAHASLSAPLVQQRTATFATSTSSLQRRINVLMVRALRAGRRATVRAPAIRTSERVITLDRRVIGLNRGALAMNAADDATWPSLVALDRQLIRLDLTTLRLDRHAHLRRGSNLMPRMTTLTARLTALGTKVSRIRHNQPAPLPTPAPSPSPAPSDPTPSATPTVSPTPTPQPTLLRSDEFSGAAGAAPDSSKWKMDTGLHCLGNDELEYYTARACNVALDGEGHLAITARAEKYGSGGDTRSYTSGMIDTRGLYSTMYGSIQARIKLPSGRGLWPAFWAMPANPAPGVSSPGEIDVMENLGQDPYTAYGHIHGPTTPATPQGYYFGTSVQSATSLADDFHTYGVNWSPTFVQFTLDGVPYATYTPSSLSGDQQWVFDQPFFLVLNLAVGGNWPGAPDATTQFPATMLVDWVRVYSWN
jgi:beta-glucanase (GH16 family)